MRKLLAMLCCAVLSAAASGYYLHHHPLKRSRHYHPPAIAINRSMETLVIINLQAHHRQHLPLQLATPLFARQWSADLLTSPSSAAAHWPGLNGSERGNSIATGTAPGARIGPSVPAQSGTGATPENLDIGDGAAYAQLSLDRPCQTIAHCNLLGVRAIHDGMPQKAVRPFRTALELATQQHNQYMTLIGYHNLAMAYWWMKHYRQAAAWAEKGLFNTPPTALASDREGPVAQD